MKFTLALVQLAATQSIQENIAKSIEACRKAKSLGADLVLFPEMYLIGYQQSLMTMDNAYSVDDPEIAQFGSLAKELDIAIAITYLGKGKQKPRNTVTLFDRHGKNILTYSKVHICSFEGGTETNLEAGDDFSTVTLDTKMGPVKIGAMICFDREFPESARTLMLKGAEIILVPNACDLKTDTVLGDIRLAQIRSRAFENMVGIALANYPKPLADGNSCAINVNGSIYVQAKEDEEILIADFDLNFIREWRKKEVWGGVCKRPETYRK